MPVMKLQEPLQIFVVDQALHSLGSTISTLTGVLENYVYLCACRSQDIQSNRIGDYEFKEIVLCMINVYNLLIIHMKNIT